MAGPGKSLAQFWPRDAVDRLASAWIDAPFQLVSIASSPAGLESMAELTGLPLDEVRQLVQKTRLLLNADELDQLRNPVRAEEMPLGALSPKDRR